MNRPAMRNSRARRSLSTARKHDIEDHGRPRVPAVDHKLRAGFPLSNKFTSGGSGSRLKNAAPAAEECASFLDYDGLALIAV